MFNVAQSFFLDKEAVQGSPVAFLTSVDLYFQSKPTSGKSASGMTNPGVYVNICSIVDGIPDLNSVDYRSFSRVELGNINVSTTAATSTKFTFQIPVPFETNKEYAVLISFDGNDNEFVLWKNSSNQADVITGQASKVSAGKVDGNYFDISNGTAVTRNNQVDLKFAINVAKFTGALSNTFTLCNDAYEFISLTSGSVNGRFIGGEYVYQAQSNLAGSVTVSSGSPNITGSGTSFVADIANGNLIVVSNSSASQVRKVNIVTNTTFMNVTTNFSTSVASANIHTYQTGILSVDSSSNTITGTGTSFSSVSVGSCVMITDGTDANTEMRKVISVDLVANQLVLDVRPSFSNSTAAYFISPTAKVENYRSYTDTLVLNNSAANSSVYFASGRILKSVDFQANAIISTINNLSLAAYRPSYRVVLPAGTSSKYFVNFANTSYAKSSNNNVEVNNKNVRSTESNHPAQIASRSNEVLNSTNLFANSKSMNATLVFSSDNPFVSPYVTENNLDFVTAEFSINNSSTNEAYANGSALTKYVSKTVTLEEDQIAEDLIVYLTAFKPAGTDIEVYVRLLSEEDNEFITDKNWTELTLDIPSGSSVNSIDSNPNDLVELRYKIPNFGTGTKVTTGTFSTASATKVVTGSYSTVNTNIAVGNLVKVYNPTFPDTYFVDIVTAANTTTFTVSNTISNNDVVGVGLNVDVITDRNTAFLNNQNYNVVRYFNSSSAKYDGYKAFAVKIVLLADNYYLVPRVAEYRAIAVSA